jgi:hypothetical protein
MANGFLQNSFRVGTPERGGGDLLSAFLGINTNPDVQLKGQAAGARLGNLDARTRRSNILGQQDAIELADMQELRDKFGKGTPEREAVINPRFASGQMGLATRTDRLNKEDSLANLAASGFTMNINGEQIPLTDLINTMSGPDFKAFATATPEVANIFSKIKNRDFGGVLDRELTELKKLSEGKLTEKRGAEIKNLGQINEINQSKITKEEALAAVAEIDEKIAVFGENYEKAALIGKTKKLNLELDKLARDLGLDVEGAKHLRRKTIKETLEIYKLAAALNIGKGQLSLKELNASITSLTAAYTAQHPAGQPLDEKAMKKYRDAANVTVIANAKNAGKAFTKLKQKPNEEAKAYLNRVLKELQPEAKLAVETILEGNLAQPVGPSDLLAEVETAESLVGSGNVPTDITGGGSRIAIGPDGLSLEAQPDLTSVTPPTDAGVVADLIKPPTVQPQLPETAPVTVTGRDKIQQGPGGVALRFKPADLEAMTQAMPNEMPTILAALAAGDIDGLLGLAQDYRDATPPELAKAELIENAVKKAMGDAKLGVR